MVILIDDCRDCQHHFMHFGSIVICSYKGLTTVRNAYEASWGPVYVTDCPLESAAEMDAAGPLTR